MRLPRLPIAGRARPARNRRLLPHPAGQPARPTAARTVGTDQRPAAREPATRRARRPARGRHRPPTRAPRSRAARAARSRARTGRRCATPAPARLPPLRRPPPRRPGDRGYCRTTATSAPATATGSARRTSTSPPPPCAGLDEIVAAQRHHLRLLRRHGPAATYDAVLTGFLICGHIWAERRRRRRRCSTRMDRPGRRPDPGGHRDGDVQRLPAVRGGLSRSRRPRRPDRLAHMATPGRAVMPISSNNSSQRWGAAWAACTTTWTAAMPPSPTG